MPASIAESVRGSSSFVNLGTGRSKVRAGMSVSLARNRSTRARERQIDYATPPKQEPFLRRGLDVIARILLRGLAERYQRVEDGGYVGGSGAEEGSGNRLGPSWSGGGQEEIVDARTRSGRVSGQGLLATRDGCTSTSSASTPRRVDGRVVRFSEPADRGRMGRS